MICHGQGVPAGDPNTDPFLEGCCLLTHPTVCPNRWFIDWAGDIGPAETVYDADRTALGLVDDAIRDMVGNSKPRRDRVKAQTLNIKFLCTAALTVIGADPSLLNDRPAFDAAWEATAEYQPIADIWEAMGKPRNWCMLYGAQAALDNTCCFSETQAVNDAKAAVLDPVAVQVRSASTGAN